MAAKLPKDFHDAVRLLHRAHEVNDELRKELALVRSGNEGLVNQNAARESYVCELEEECKDLEGRLDASSKLVVRQLAVIGDMAQAAATTADTYLKLLTTLEEMADRLAKKEG